MKRLMLVGMVVALLAAWSVSSVTADETKTPTIKTIMKKLHGGRNSLLRQVDRELKAEQPNWIKLQKQSQQFATLGAELVKNEPRRGSKESWEKLSQLYCDNAKAFDDAAQKHDQTAATSAVRKLTQSCMGCHRAHRARRG